MTTVEETVRQVRYLGTKAKRRVENDVDVVYDKTKSILESWETMRFMDMVWTARADDQHPVTKLRPYLIGVAWMLALILMYSIYFIDVSWTDSAIWWYLTIRGFELACIGSMVLCLICCFEQGLDLVMGGLFVLSVFRAAPPRKPSNRGGRPN